MYRLKDKIFLRKNDKSVAVHNKCPQIPQSTSIHSATGVRRSRALRLSLSSNVFTPAAVPTFL